MRKLFSFLLLFLPFSFFAQYFSEAPKLDRPVKKIIEWQTAPQLGNSKQETLKGGEYTFRRDGKLLSFKSNDVYEKDYSYRYDKKGRIEKVNMKEKYGGREMVYSYSDKTKKAEIKSDSIYLVTTQFLDEKGRVVEEKTSGKAPFTAGQFSIISRKVLNYNKAGEVFGEMEYNYAGNKTASRKTVHHFDPKNGKKLKTLYYDENKKLAQTTEYIYTENGRLGIVDTKRPDSDFWIRKEFREKDGQPWLEIEYIFHEEERIEKVFKEGRLVRTKYFSDDELYFYTDFQYLFW